MTIAFAGHILVYAGDRGTLVLNHDTGEVFDAMDHSTFSDSGDYEVFGDELYARDDYHVWGYAALSGPNRKSVMKPLDTTDEALEDRDHMYALVLGPPDEGGIHFENSNGHDA